MEPKKRSPARQPARLSTRYFSHAELDRLASMRAGFLVLEQRSAHEQGGDYWLDAEDVELYDSTFGQRIGWKWDAVLSELAAKQRAVRGATVLDWGCGSGIAVRRWLAAGGAEGARRVFLWDHSPVAREFAAKSLREEFSGIEVRIELPSEPPEVLLVSHVLGELGPSEQDGLLDLARSAGHVLWVEPGNRGVSQRLGQLRALLLAEHEVLAPCPHQEQCGALGAARNLAWCHFFARPPEEVYTEGRWNEFGRELGIDLRSLPYSFLALARRQPSGTPLAPLERYRLLGRPRMLRGRALLDVCDAEGVRVMDFLQRFDKGLFRELGSSPGWLRAFDAEVEGTRIHSLKRRE